MTDKYRWTDRIPCRNPLCWNVVFVWDGPDCSAECRLILNPPIVHAAGRLPPEVEQAVTEQIEQRNEAAEIAAWAGHHGMSFTDWQRAMLAAMPPPHTAPSMNVTVPRGRAVITKGGEVHSYVLDEVQRWLMSDPTPEPGWLKRRLRRWFG